MNKKRKIEESISKVFKALVEAPRDSSGEAWMTGNQLQEVTKLSPMEINDAVSILGQQRYVELGETYGVAPFDFNVVTLNARGRLEFERRKSQEGPKPEYVKEKHREWDIFISHASEDKNEIVRPLANALKKVGFRVWYDEIIITLGDSLRRSIDKGLARSKFGLVVLSPDFFKKEWPKRELDGLTTRELRGEKVILPVWHNVDREYVAKFSPTLANKFAVSTEKGIDKVVEEILKAVKPSKTRKSVEASTTERLKELIRSLKEQERESIKETLRGMEFNDLRRMFLDVLDGVALFDLPDSSENAKVFDFVLAAILERNKEEGAELFEILLNWFFGTVTPSCKRLMLKMFAHLTRASYLKKVVSDAQMVSGFVAEFAASASYETAGVNSEILQNMKSALSESNCRRIVESALSNDQIHDSWRAKEYLRKILTSCEGKVDQEKIEELHKRII